VTTGSGNATEAIPLKASISEMKVFDSDLSNGEILSTLNFGKESNEFVSDGEVVF
jgi:hypothetical protein